MRKFRRKDQQSVQEELWLRPQELVRGPQDGFYSKLNGVLARLGFTESVHRHCAPYYKIGTSGGGRPPVDPAVMFKMLIVSFLEGLGSERGIASRCADSLTIRRFLGYSLTEPTPEHSSFTVFRQRLPQEVFAAVHLEVLQGLTAHGLLKGRHLGVDSSVIEANASLSGLASRRRPPSGPPGRFLRPGSVFQQAPKVPPTAREITGTIRAAEGENIEHPTLNIQRLNAPHRRIPRPSSLHPFDVGFACLAESALRTIL